jgi:hypothetical protein
MVVEATATAEAKASKFKAAAAAAAAASAAAAAAASAASAAAARAAQEAVSSLQIARQPEIKVARPKVEVYADNDREEEDDLEGCALII